MDAVNKNGLTSISTLVIDWYSREKRDLPWRGTQDPYKIWLSEIILQQTRVAQGLPYYLAFLENFPTVYALANASEKAVLRAWQGLGYYSRARNLHKTAKIVAFERQGKFPDNSKDLLLLPGVGSYTAAAIASIAFEEDVPVLDGNVFRVLARLFGLDHDISQQTNKKYFLEKLHKMLPQKQASAFNQGMMELGALICTPKNPSCPSCPISVYCYALSTKEQLSFPVKSNKIKIKQRLFHYLVFEFDGRFALSQRKTSDIWQGLYEFLLFEGEGFDWRSQVDETEVAGYSVSQEFRHVLTHQRINARFYHFQLRSEESLVLLSKKYGLTEYSMKQIVTLPKSKLILKYLEASDFL